ncbi:MAG: cytidylate kinase-like family protein [Bacteroidales bacterium]|nr:cytidylate kinase-like family protein [Bacteroidales bacterium]
MVARPKRIAAKLSEELTLVSKAHTGKDITWRWMGKELLEEAAGALDMVPDDIKYVFEFEKKGVIDDIISAQFNKYYKSDRKIRNTIAKVIRDVSFDGHVIIVGRGGVAITRDLANSLHINLEAPLEWRAARISEKEKMSIDEAKKYIGELDKKRSEFRNYFQGTETDYTRFDISYNVMTLTVDEIVSHIAYMVKLRGLF